MNPIMKGRVNHRGRAIKQIKTMLKNGVPKSTPWDSMKTEFASLK